MREMRRFKQLLPETESISILERRTAGVLSLIGEEEYPYGVPMSYVYADGRILFHSAIEGHKIDAIRNHAKASFCVIDQDQVVPEEYTTYFRSVIAFGHIHIIEEEQQKRDAIEKLAARYSPEQVEGRKKEIDKTFDRLYMIELSVEHLTGKSAKELVGGK